MLQSVKKKGIRISAAIVLSALLICVSGFFVQANGTAAVTAQMRSMKDSAYAGTGTTEDPYRIAVAGNADGKNTAFTAPSAFWKGTGANDISEDAVVFERHKGDVAEGKLISSMEFNMGKNKTQVWDGTWKYALRLAPWTGFDTTDGDLKVGFCYKGDFSTYFKDWKFTFDVQTLTASLSEEKQVRPGDIIALTYLGAYDPAQTSRGTNYKIDFSDVDQDVEVSLRTVVDADGYAVFEGAQQLLYGGNYIVEKIETPVSSIAVTGQSGTVITEKNGTLQMQAQVFPEYATNKSYTWSITEGSEKAVLDENGLLTAKEDGQVTVRATSAANPDIFGECVVTISGQSEKPEEDNGNHEIGGGNDTIQKPKPEEKPEGLQPNISEPDPQTEVGSGKEDTQVPQTADPFSAAAGIVLCLAAAAGVLLTGKKVLK